MKLKQGIIIALAAVAGWSAAKLSSGHHEHAADSRRILCYQSPMHPWVKADKPGQCTVCGMALVPVYEGGAGFDKTVEGVVMLPPGSPSTACVQTSVVKKQPLIRTLRVAGMIGEDESRHGVISAPVDGRIDALPLNHEGQTITLRQPLVTIFSRTLLKAADDYKAALAQGGAAVVEAQRRLEQLGLVSEQIQTIPKRQPDDKYFGLVSPLGGVIVKAWVSEGQYVKEGDKLFEIADFTRMWFMFDAYEQDLPFIKVGQNVSVTTPSLPGQTLKGRVSFVSPNLDDATRTTKVRVILENPDRQIKNNTYASASIELEAPEILAVPRTALLWSGGIPRVYVARGEGAYEQCAVKLGRMGDHVCEMLEGLDEGDAVVTCGNMLIDSQAQIDAMAGS